MDNGIPDDLFAELFEGELRAAEVKQLREALERRAAMIREAQQRGELPVADADAIEALQRQLEVLQEEELISEFTEHGLAGTLRRQRLLDALGEGEE